MRKIKRQKWSDLTPQEELVANMLAKSILLEDIKNHKREVPPKDLKPLTKRGILNDLFHIKLK